MLAPMDARSKLAVKLGKIRSREERSEPPRRGAREHGRDRGAGTGELERAVAHEDGGRLGSRLCGSGKARFSSGGAAPHRARCDRERASPWWQARRAGCRVVLVQRQPGAEGHDARQRLLAAEAAVEGNSAALAEARDDDSRGVLPGAAVAAGARARAQASGAADGATRKKRGGTSRSDAEALGLAHRCPPAPPSRSETRCRPKSLQSQRGPPATDTTRTS